MNIEGLIKFNVLYLDKKYLRVFVGLFFLSCLQISFISYLTFISFCIIYRGIYLTVYNKEENYLKKRILKVLGTTLIIGLILFILIAAFRTDSTQINESENIIGYTIALVYLISFLFFIFLLANISVNRINIRLKYWQLLLFFLIPSLFVLFIKDKLINKTSEL